MYGTVHHQRSNSTMATEPEGGGNHGTEEVEVETVLKQFDHWQEVGLLRNTHWHPNVTCA